MKEAQIKYGLYFGVPMYITMIFIWPYLDGDVISFRKILIGIPIWFSSGFLQGYIFATYNRQIKNSEI